MQYLIFDFDGVLADTWEASIRAMMKLNNTTWDAELKAFMEYFDTPSHTRYHKISSSSILSRKQYISRFAELLLLEGFDLFSGFIEQLKIHKEESKMAVVSSGSKKYINDKLISTDLDFTHILTIEDHHSKEIKIEQILLDWEINVNEVFYFTDTKTDVLELKDFISKDKLFGCSWGYHGRDELLKVLEPKQIIDRFDQFKDVIRSFD